MYHDAIFTFLKKRVFKNGFIILLYVEALIHEFSRGLLYRIPWIREVDSEGEKGDIFSILEQVYLDCRNIIVFKQSSTWII